MNSRQNSNGSKLRAALRTMSLCGCALITAGCAAKYTVTPPSPEPRVSLTPLSPAVQRIDSQSSAGYLEKLSSAQRERQSWLQKVEASLSNETPK